jgi:DNA-binding response OmpR family regulator
MNKAAVRVLLVDDDEDERVTVADLLKEAGAESFDLGWVPTYEQGLQKILAGECDVCLVDYRLGERSGLDLLVEATAQIGHPQIILLTGRGNRGVDVIAANAGRQIIWSKANLPRLYWSARFVMPWNEDVRLPRCAMLENRSRSMLPRTHF